MIRSLAAVTVALVLSACNPLDVFSFGGSWAGAYTHPIFGTADVAMTIEVRGLAVDGTWALALPGVIDAEGTLSGAVTLAGLEVTLESDALDGCGFEALVRPRGFAVIATVSSIDCPVDLTFDVDLLRLGQ